MEVRECSEREVAWSGGKPRRNRLYFGGKFKLSFELKKNTHTHTHMQHKTQNTNETTTKQKHEINLHLCGGCVSHFGAQRDEGPQRDA